MRDKYGNKACIQCKIGNSSVEVDKICNKFADYKIFICVLDERQKNTYIIYTTEIEGCNTESDTKSAKEFIEKIRKCCYSIITKEMIEELNKDFKKFKAIEVMQIKNKNLNYSISPTEFKKVIEELIDEIT